MPPFVGGSRPVFVLGAIESSYKKKVLGKKKGCGGGGGQLCPWGYGRGKDEVEEAMVVTFNI